MHVLIKVFQVSTTSQYKAIFSNTTSTIFQSTVVTMHISLLSAPLVLEGLN